MPRTATEVADRPLRRVLGLGRRVVPHELVTCANCRMGRSILIYCGIAWAERSHDVALVDDNGQLLAKRHITDDAAGYKIFLGLLVEYGDSEENPACRTASSENGRRCTCAQAGRSLRSPFRGGRQGARGGAVGGGR